MTLVRKDKTGGFLEVRHYKDLLIQLVSRDLKLKYRRSVLGYVWSVLNPLLIMLVMYVVFSKLFDRNIPNFPVYLLVGRTMYDFVVGATNKAMDGITSNAALLKKTYVSKYMFPLAKVTSCMVDYVLSLGALLIVLIFTGSPFYWTMLLFPLITLEAYISLAEWDFSSLRCTFSSVTQDIYTMRLRRRGCMHRRYSIRLTFFRTG